MSGSDPLASLDGPVRRLVRPSRSFPGGPTPAQRLAWPPIASGENLLLVSPTGTGKTLAAFLAIIDGLYPRACQGGHPRARPAMRLRLASAEPGLRHRAEPDHPARGDPPRPGAGAKPDHRRRPDRRHLGLPAQEAPRAAAAPADHHARKPQPDAQPESSWHETWRGVRHLVVDEVHALVPTKRGADLAVSLERLAEKAGADPARVGLSATCRPAEPVARFLVGPSRTCRVVEAPRPLGTPELSHRGRVAPQARRGQPSRADLSPVAPQAPQGDRRGQDDRGLRQHPGPDREGHPRPPPRHGGRPRGRRRPPLGARRRTGGARSRRR